MKPKKRGRPPKKQPLAFPLYAPPEGREKKKEPRKLELPRNPPPEVPPPRLKSKSRRSVRTVPYPPRPERRRPLSRLPPEGYTPGQATEAQPRPPPPPSIINRYKQRRRKAKVKHRCRMCQMDFMDEKALRLHIMKTHTLELRKPIKRQLDSQAQKSASKQQRVEETT